MKLHCTLMLCLGGSLTRRRNEVWWYVPQEIKRHLTVVLTVVADGVVLPALAIFKGEKCPKFHEVGVFIRAQEKAWMDKTMMLEWIDLVWEPATEGCRLELLHFDAELERTHN